MSARLSDPITLLGGLPGHGKTLMAITYAVEARKEGQRTYQVGITDCNVEVAELWCPDGVDGVLMRRKAEGLEERRKAVERWRELPPGAILIIDEAQDYFPVRGPGRPPEWIGELARLRHYGVQIWLLTQDVRNLDSFVRRLIGAHLHIERKMNTYNAVVFRWEHVVEDARDYHARKNAVKSGFRYVKKYFQFYTSASQHLVKRKIPWQVMVGVPVVLGALVACFFAYRLFTGHGAVTEHLPGVAAVGAVPGVSSNQPGVPGLASSSQGVSFVGLSVADYAAKFVPRVATRPWSAPAFDDRKVVSQPEMFCIDVQASKCRCYSEQGTAIAGVPQYQCRIASVQGVYNPFRAPGYAAKEDSTRRGDKDRDGPARRPVDRSGYADSERSSPTASTTSPSVSEWPRPDFRYQVPFPVVSK